MKVALLMPSALNGGVQRIMINLSKGFLNYGYDVDFLIADATGEMLSNIPKNCNIIDFKKIGLRGDLKILFSLRNIKKYIKQNPNICIISAPGLSGTILSYLKKKKYVFNSIVMVDNKISLLKDGTLYHTLVYYLNKHLFCYSNFIVPAHENAKKDLINNYKLLEHNVRRIYHPIIDEGVLLEQNLELNHRFFDLKKRGYKILISIGRLVPEKDFENLIQAFSMVKKKNKVKLIILGDGPLKDELENYANLLNCDDDIDFYGYTSNVYEFIKKSDALILSSKQEAFGNVLIEAMANGIPVVTTDCQSGGPREIMMNEKSNLFGDICPCENSKALANSIDKVINNIYDINLLKERSKEFTIDFSTREYLHLIKELYDE